MKLILTAAAALALAAPLAAQAQPPGHGGHPPGLAKKPMGMPPGQAKKIWNTGERLPAEYLRQSYYFSDYGRYRLAAPPPGHRWVRVDGDVYLVKTETGLIVDLARSLLH